MITVERPKLTPFPYQSEGMACAYSDWDSGFQRLLICLPTGMGKTLIMCLMTADVHAKGGRVVIIVNRDELVSQTVDTLATYVDRADIGIVKAAKNHSNARVIVASIQTLGRSGLRREQIGDVDLIVVDEAHHAAANSYMNSVRHLGGWNGTRVIGFTATAIRTDGLGLGDIWERITYRRTVEYAWQHGYLIKPEVRQIRVGNDAQSIARAYLAEAGHRQGIVTTSTVRKAVAIAAALNAVGLPATVITGTTPVSERKAAYAAIANGSLRVLVQVNVLTEGFDSPRLEVAMLTCKMGQLRTVQTVGRVIRLFKGDEFAPAKTSALVLDAVGALIDNSLSVTPDLSLSVPGKRMPTALPKRKGGVCEYKIHVHTRFWRRRCTVTRIEGASRTRVAVIHGGTDEELKAKGRLAARADQARRAAAIGVQLDELTTH